MKTFYVTGEQPDNRPLGDFPNMLKAMNANKKSIVRIEEYTDESPMTNAQMAYIHTIVIPELMTKGESEFTAELELKTQCGERWFVKIVCGEKYIISKTMLTVRQGTLWIENMIDYMDFIGHPVPPPDRNWRVNQMKSPTE